MRNNQIYGLMQGGVLQGKKRLEEERYRGLNNLRN